jgi:glycosyltransferase involved in cell wall biosynthesis
MDNSTFIVHESSGVDYRSPRQLAFELAKRRPTILVDRATRWFRLQAAPLRARCRQSGPLTVYSPFELPRRWQIHSLTDPINARLWRSELARLCASPAPCAVIFDRPGQHSRVGFLGERTSAYYAHCDYTLDIIGRCDERVAEEERKMLAAVDVAFAASEILVRRFAQHAKRVIHLPCAYNGDLFDGNRSYTPPPALAAISAPKILFSGLISGRVDFLGLWRTAQERPDWAFVLVGAISSGIHEELEQTGRPRDLADRFFSCRNVHYLGQVPLTSVAPIVAACDVGLVPYCLSQFTMTSSPIKTFEYLAMGKPVVSTAVPEAVGVAEEILIAEEAGLYVAPIETALARSGNPAFIRKHKTAVQQHSMSARADAVLAALGSAR